MSDLKRSTISVWRNAHPCILSRTIWFVLPMLTLTGTAADGQKTVQPSSKTPILTTARQAHSLTSDQAARAYPVDLHGVVTYYDPYQDEGRHPALFIRDATAGIFVRLTPGSPLPLHPGTGVEVTGNTDPGGYAPIIVQSKVRISGTSQPLSKPLHTTLPHLLTGVEDGQWVEIDGVVRSVESYDHHVVLTLSTNDGPMTVTAVKQDGDAYTGLVDSVVSVRAVAAPLVDSQRQMTGARLLCPGLSYISIQQPALADPFALPLRSLGSVLQYKPNVGHQRRIHVRGGVTLFWPGRSLCIQDGKDGICVQTRNRTELQHGELVDVVGFPSLVNSIPTLSETTVRRTGNTLPDVVTRITPELALSGQRESQLVQIEGRLIGRSLVMTDAAFLLSSGGTVFFVVLPSSSDTAGGKQWPVWVEGSRLLVTGVLSGKVDAQETNRREGITRFESFQILLRSPADVVVLQVPSWWTANHALTLLGLVAVLTVAVLVWVVVLRHRVAQQTYLVRCSEERFRHMAEHDSLTGLTSRASLHDYLGRALEQARELARPLAVLTIDLDHFKHVNDSLGHAAGDEVLQTVARRLQASLRHSDTVARMGGDEFLAVLPEVQDREELDRIAAKVVSNVSAPIDLQGRQIPVSISVGISIYPEDGASVALLLQRGDMAMYRAKALGRNRYQFFTSDMTEVRLNQPVERMLPSEEARDSRAILPTVN